MARNFKASTINLTFAKLGVYHMHTHPLVGDEIGAPKLFHCAIRDSNELLTEYVEIHRGEVLHGHDEKGEIEWPLVKFDADAFWVYMPKQEVWWPLRKGKVQFDLDRWNRVRIKWLESPGAMY